MTMNWYEIERFLVGEAWLGSEIKHHLYELCDHIGPRWASSEGEWAAIRYIQQCLTAQGLDQVAVEEYPLQTWAYDQAQAQLAPGGPSLDLRPFNRCPSIDLEAPLQDVGYGTPAEIAQVADKLPGAIALMNLTFQPFTPPVPHAIRLQNLAEAGASVALVIDKKSGKRMEYHNLGDWREQPLEDHPLPSLTTSREDGARLRRLLAQGEPVRLSLKVDSRFYSAPSANVLGTLEGKNWPNEVLVLGGHHDTVYGTPGGNDNASGVIAVLETARILAKLKADQGIQPGRSIHFVTFSAEEQKFQGTYAYIARHFHQNSTHLPRLAINLDELSTGHFKGLVLSFPHLQAFIQKQFDQMGEDHQAQVMAQLDPTSDHLPFLKAGIDAAHAWRWRFHSRHADAEYHHEAADTADKVNIRELKDYAAHLARLLLRLSYEPPAAWPQNNLKVEAIAQRLQAETGQVVRVF